MLENKKRFMVWGKGHDQCMMHGNVTVDQINFLQIIRGSNYNDKFK